MIRTTLCDHIAFLVRHAECLQGRTSDEPRADALEFVADSSLDTRFNWFIKCDGMDRQTDADSYIAVTVSTLSVSKLVSHNGF